MLSLYTRVFCLASRLFSATVALYLGGGGLHFTIPDISAKLER